MRFTIVLLLACVMGGSLAFAQALRTWVSGVGDDANPGSRTAPCKTFAGCISKTAAGGEIDALDPGGFGAVTITKSLTIDGGGTFASILGAGTNAITVNAGVNDVVQLRNLSINGAGTGLNGIRFIAGGTLIIENCVIFNFAQKGVDFEPAGTSRLIIKNTIIRNCNNAVNGGAVLVKPGAAGAAVVAITKSSMIRCLFGLRAENSTVTLEDCVLSGNVNGVIGNLGADVFVNNCVISDNSTNGVLSGGAGTVIRVSNNTIFGNDRGIAAQGGGSLVSFGNNRIRGNGTDLVGGAPTSTEAEQ